MTPAQRAEMVERDRRAERLALAKETSSTTAEIEWMQRIVDFQKETTDPIEFLETLKLDLEEDEVYVFTPKGKVIALAANATPVDFAYSIHTEVGHRCIGAKVNGRLVPLDTRLNSADTVEIFTSKSETAGPAGTGCTWWPRRGPVTRSASGSRVSGARTPSSSGATS